VPTAKSFGDPGPLTAERVPVLRVDEVDVPEASTADPNADLDRLARAAYLDSGLTAGPFALAELRTRLGQAARVRAVSELGTLVAVRPTDRNGPWALAIDIGSTTLAVGLVHLGDGRVEATDSRLNPQVAYGADVVSRIAAAGRPDVGLSPLMNAVRAGLAAMVRDLLDTAQVDPMDVVAAACAGNPTMMHLWAGVDVAPLGQAPYVGTWVGDLACPARDVDLPIHPNASVWSFPSVRSHVGGDAVAAALAVGLDQSSRPRLLIDLGTNSEVLVGSLDGVVAASTAAGPAFEGATISCGMRADRGAIDAVTILANGQLGCTTIGHDPARGLCGSGLVDAVAELLRAGVISSSGYLLSADELVAAGSASLAGRISLVSGRRAFEIAHDRDRGGPRVVLTAPDIRQLQLAKGSICAAISILCREMGIGPQDLDEVAIAGAFGTYVRKASLLRIGLVPAIDPERVTFVGNGAGAGARLAVLDRRVRDRARRFASSTRYVDLATHPGYLAAFHEALSFAAEAT
jgi:uncharacterized 2Fe-2S/4Fe-4S cluster protein (DUF4445 family)